MGLSIYYCKSFNFSLITDRDCVALPNVDISTSAPPMDEVAVACPPACNNSDARGRAIYIGAVADAGGGTTYACSSPPLGRRATTDVAVGLMQVVLAPDRLSPSPSCTLRPVFVQGFFIKQANGLSQRCLPPLLGRHTTACSRVTITLAIAYSQTSLRPGVLFFFFFGRTQ
jgi:hypothetical protein